MKITRRALLTAAAASVLPAIGATLLTVPRKLAKEPLPTHPLPYPRRAPAQVTVSNIAQLPLGIDMGRFVAAMQRYVTEFLAPVWGCPAQLRWAPKPIPGTMNLVFVDQSDAPGAIAYHNFDPAIARAPYGEIAVFESYTNATHELGVPFSHELGEMLVNPGINMWAGVGVFEPPGEDDDGNPTRAKDTVMRAYEIADPVERTYFKLDGFDMSNFVYPAYFEPWADGQLDYLGILKTPGEVLPGGYQIFRDHDDLIRVVNPSSDEMCYRVKAVLRAHLRKSLA